MNFATQISALALCCCLSLASPVSAAEFYREDASLPRQLERAEQVLVGRIQGAEPAQRAGRVVLTVAVEQMLKGEPSTRHVLVEVRVGDTLAPEQRYDVPGLFVLTRGDEGDSAPWRLERQRASLLWLDGPQASWTLNLAEASLRGDAGARRLALIDALRGGTPELATDALHALLEVEELPSPRVAALVLEALELDRARLQDLGLAIELLGRTGDRNVQPALLDLLRGERHFGAYAALGEALRNTGLEPALRSLGVLGQAGDPRVRRRAARALGELGPDATAALLRATQDPDAGVRARAALALGAAARERASSAAAALSRLQALLGEGASELERRAAALGLIALGRPGVRALRLAPASELRDGVLRSPAQARYAVEWALRQLASVTKI